MQQWHEIMKLTDRESPGHWPNRSERRGRAATPSRCELIVRLLPLIVFAFAIALSPPARAAETRTARSSEQIEDEFWLLIRDSQVKSDFESYLKEYPSGRYTALARLQITRLARNGESVPKDSTVREPGARPSAPKDAGVPANALSVGDVVTYIRTFAEFKQDVGKVISRKVTRVGADGSIEFDGNVRYRSQAHWDETSAVDPIFDGFPPLRQLALPLVPDASWSEEFETMAEAYPHFVMGSGAPTVSAPPTLSRQLRMNVYADVYVEGPSPLAQLPWVKDAILIHTKTKYQTSIGNTVSKAKLWYSPSLARFVRIQRDPIFVNPDARTTIGVWGQKVVIELADTSARTNTKRQNADAAARKAENDTSEFPPNARPLANGSWECLPGHLLYEGRRCVPVLSN